MNKLEQLKRMTTVVADTGDFDAIRRYRPVDATTNPSLLLKAFASPDLAYFIDEALQWSRGQGESPDDRMARCIDRLAVMVGVEISRHIPGRVSTEVSARLSFDTRGTVDRARRLIDLYGEQGVGPERILIKIASTWEGIRAAEILEKEGIHCNLTLLFSFAQARACADAGVYLVSPFVGRIHDWYLKATGEEHTGADDPGVRSVRRIYNYYKHHGYDTVVMGASFRNTGQIEALAGCDRLTISPQLLDALESREGELPRALDAGLARSGDDRVEMDEQAFRWQLNEDAMATEKLAEGIRIFAEDERKLSELIETRSP